MMISKVRDQHEQHAVRKYRQKDSSLVKSFELFSSDQCTVNSSNHSDAVFQVENLWKIPSPACFMFFILRILSLCICASRVVVFALCA